MNPRTNQNPGTNQGLDIGRLRTETPGCHDRIHLNNAGAALMPRSVIDAVHAHIDLEAQIGGYEAADARNDALTATYRALGQLVGARPEHIAVTQSATASFASALSAIAFEPGEVILTTRNDYVSNQLQFMSLASRYGVRVVHAPDAPEGGVDVEGFAALLRREKPRLVSVTHAPTNSGLVQDVESIGQLCREHEVLYIVDACQTVGQWPLDVDAIGCDFLAATSRKFLRGPRGAGFLFVSQRALDAGLAPLMVDLRGAQWQTADRFTVAPTAQRYERFEVSLAAVLGMGEAARYAGDLGIEPVRERIQSLAARLRAALAALDGVRVLDRGRVLSGIVSIAVRGHDPGELMLTLRERGLNTSAQFRTSAVLDYDDKGVGGSLRLSPHAYNTEDEIDAAVAMLREVIAH